MIPLCRREARNAERTPLPYGMRSLGYPRLYMRGTTQGGPRSEGRSCGTGGDPALVEGKITLLTMDTEKNWKMIAGRVRWMKPGSRGRMRPGTPPAEKLPLAGMSEVSEGS